MHGISWDVFLSHNRQQKLWVRRVANQWRELGLRVFFDEDSLEPGEDSVSGIERGLEGSRHVVMVLSPDSVASRWVAMESAITIFGDPDASERRLIPLVLEPTPESDIRLAIRRLNRVDLTNAAGRRERYHRLLRFLGVCRDELPEFPPFAPRTALPALETGTMPSDSTYYVEREADRLAAAKLCGAGATVVVKGPRQVGKSSLLSRLHSAALDAGRRSCFIDFQSLDQSLFTDLNPLFLALAGVLSEELDIPAEPEEHWSATRGAKQNLRQYLERVILPDSDSPLQIIFDEADLTFGHPTCSELFSTIRHWHNRRATARKHGWKTLDLVISHATSPELWIPDAKQSPFNVGTRVRLLSFDDEQVAELNAKHGSPLTAGEIERIQVLLGGQPYLVRVALFNLAGGHFTFSALETVAPDEDGPFTSYISNYLSPILKNTTLKDAVIQVLFDGQCDDEAAFQRLLAAGLVQGKSRRRSALRCKLYEEYFRGHA